MIVVLSGGFVDVMNPPEVRDRMDQYIADINADPYVQAHTNGKGLTFKLLSKQAHPHIHQAQWRKVAKALEVLRPSPLVLVGHSNGGAAAVSIARSLETKRVTVDLLCTHDSVQTIDDLGEPNGIPGNVRINLNPYVIPTPAWMLAPFPIGRRNRRDDGSLEGLLNVGLTYNLGGAFAHKNAFYELAGGYQEAGGGFGLPHILLDVTLAALRGATTADVLTMLQPPIQTLATKSRIVIQLETKDFRRTFEPEAIAPPALVVDAKNAVSLDIRRAIDALPKRGRKVTYAGPVRSDKDGGSHIQGVAGSGNYFLLTHSDKSDKAGRILVVDRRPEQRKFVTEYRLPALDDYGPPLNHAGGCQAIGDVLAVPSESGRNSSVVAFFDISNPLRIRELHASLRIVRTQRDAAAVGITTITRNGHNAWLCGVYDSGSVDFYESPDLPGGAPFHPILSSPIKVDEKHHQALLLFTDSSNRVFAAGLNRGNFPYFDRLVLYSVDLVTKSMVPDPDRSYSTGGVTRLRWGADLESVGSQLVLHCTERNYGKSCDIKTFVPPERLPKRAEARARRPATVRTGGAARTPGKGATRKAARRERKRSMRS
ncbi:MAG: hypothetical protein AB1635_10520 [Acidobacteriota bacterium]